MAEVSLAQTIAAAREDSVKVGCSSPEEMPVYPGGVGEMMKFISKNMNNPNCPVRSIGCFKCYLSFIVSASGKLEDIKVVKGVEDCPDYEIEAMKVLKMMPNWKPALRLGVPIDCKMNLPISVMLK